MTGDRIRELSVIAVRDAIAAGDITAQAATAAAIEQAERYKDEYALFVTFTPEMAMEQARAADQARAAGKPLGPLHGVPMTVKDNIDVAGVQTSAGSKVLADRVPERDATAWAGLRAAGAITLGQTNMHEMALGGTSSNPHYGACRNPWDPTRVPGGSSGGATACVALRVGHAALGTDSAGSVRMPASFSGVVGLKQTHGLVSLAGVVPTGTWSTDHIGPVTRTVADAALLLSLMQGYDPRDPDSADKQPMPCAGINDLKGVRVGLCERYFWQDLDADVERICRAQVDLMRDAGAEIVNVDIPSLDLLVAARAATLAEAYVFHEPYLRERPEDYGEDIRYRLMAGQYILAHDYVRSTRVRRMLLDQVQRTLESVDVLASPTMPLPATKIGATAYEVNGVEIPVTGPTGGTLLIRNTQPFNWSGVPAISLPAGLTPAGLPVGFQLAAGAFEDHKLLAIASVMERLIGFDAVPRVLRGVEAGV